MEDTFLKKLGRAALHIGCTVVYVFIVLLFMAGGLGGVNVSGSEQVGLFCVGGGVIVDIIFFFLFHYIPEDGCSTFGTKIRNFLFVIVLIAKLLLVGLLAGLLPNVDNFANVQNWSLGILATFGSALIGAVAVPFLYVWIEDKGKEIPKLWHCLLPIATYTAAYPVALVVCALGYLADGLFTIGCAIVFIVGVVLLISYLKNNDLPFYAASSYVPSYSGSYGRYSGGWEEMTGRFTKYIYDVPAYEAPRNSIQRYALDHVEVRAKYHAELAKREVILTFELTFYFIKRNFSTQREAREYEDDKQLAMDDFTSDYVNDAEQVQDDFIDIINDVQEDYTGIDGTWTVTRRIR